MWASTVGPGDKEPRPAPPSLPPHDAPCSRTSAARATTTAPRMPPACTQVSHADDFVRSAHHLSLVSAATTGRLCKRQHRVSAHNGAGWELCALGLLGELGAPSLARNAGGHVRCSCAALCVRRLACAIRQPATLHNKCLVVMFVVHHY